MKWLVCIGASLAISSAFAGAPDISRVVGEVSIDAGREAGDVSTINGSVKIGDHATVADVSTINGGIHVGEGAKASSLSTINGGIHIGEGAKASSLSTINGGITLATSTHVSGDASTINGSLSLAQAADVSGRVSTVNGDIRLTAAHVGGRISTVSGDIEVGDDSRVDGGLLVDKRHYWWLSFASPRRPVVVIAPGAKVTGTLRFRQPVALYISDRATIGSIEGAEPVFYSGERP